MLRLDEAPKEGTPFSQVPIALRALVRGPRVDADIERMVATEDSVEDVIELKEPHRVLRRYAGPVRDRFGAVIGHVVAVEDVTSSWLLQQRLTHAQKMESMGRLAGGVAHDFNNLLGTVVGFGALLLEQTPVGDPRRDGLEQIVLAAERASRLTRALLKFSRSARFERTPVRLNEVVEEAYQLLRSTLDPSVVVEMKLDSHIPSLLGDAQLLQQVVVSLMQAASERLASPGVLRIVSSIDESIAPQNGTDRGETLNMVELSIETTRTRSLPEVNPAEPTFIAIPDRDGLALTIADDIARAHGGALLLGLDAAPAMFRLRLPINASRPRPAIVPEAPAARGHETILVVDDEPALRALAKGGLTQLGFDVITAASGEEALGVLRSRPHTVAAVLLDLSMPGLSGERVLRTIRSVQPDLPVIIASGFATVESQHAWRAAGAQDFVAKPYRIQDVAQKIRGILDRTRGPVG